jgi:dinuclear metal center YbgI/SA1388 family protein
MIKHSEIVQLLSEIAPLRLQESYDNSGWQVGIPDENCTGVLFTLDCTLQVAEEAIEKNCNLIVSHHPLIFNGVKRLCDQDYVQKTLRFLIQNNIALYSAHTNFDSIFQGVNYKIAEKLGLKGKRVLREVDNTLLKLVTFVPSAHLEKVSESVFKAGAGHIGNYDYCAFTSEGQGTFRAGENSNPFVGKPNEIHREKETRFETILPVYCKEKVERALIESHPYEEVAFDFYPIKNTSSWYGVGLIGELDEEIRMSDFLVSVKGIFKVSSLRHTNFHTKTVKKVAICGGSGSFLLGDAINSGADVFLSADFKYHQFFDAENNIVILDIGHYESEQFTPELFYDVTRKKFPTFALHLSKVNTNPINYF